jgi:hypothetical protein
MPESLTELLREELAQIEQRLQDLQQRREAILNLLQAYSRNNRPKSARGKLIPMTTTLQEQLSTLDMAQQVIEKHGPMKPEEIMDSIRQQFGVKPAHTLPQMLYIRSRDRKRFYRGSDGRFGLIERKKSVKKAAA